MSLHKLPKPLTPHLFISFNLVPFIPLVILWKLHIYFRKIFNPRTTACYDSDYTKVLVVELSRETFNIFHIPRIISER